MFTQNSIYLCQGDSITDAGRSREIDTQLGVGYPNIINDLLAAVCPTQNITVINRGISGNRAIDLRNRWDEDCINLKPDYVSILIGINDTWRRYDSNDPTSPEAFRDNYRNILERTLKGTRATILLCQPFILEINDDIKKMREDLCHKQEVIKELSQEYHTLYLPLDEIFKAACKYKEPSFWSGDGVHPSSAGHTLIALEILKAFGVMAANPIK